MFDIQHIREDFPLLAQKVNGRPLVYLDNAATSQKPRQVLKAISDYYETTNANIHRGVHYLSQRATDAFEQSREKIREHINATHAFEVILTSGTTHGINIVANGFASLLSPGDEVVISALEHHSNIVPWQMLCERSGAVLRVIPIDENGCMVQQEYEKLLSDRTRIVSISHISNALGTINPVVEMIRKAHQVGAAVLVDGAQAAAHSRPDVQQLNCDFYVFSSHKVCGPTGLGVLYGKQEWLEKLPPYQGGGEMIKEVSFEKTTYAGLPHKFEAGTPNIEAGIAFGAALDYLNDLGWENIQSHEESLLKRATRRLSEIDGLRIIGTSDQKTSVISFVVDGVHPYDLGAILDQQGIAVRTGHHCAQPVMSFFGIPGTVRASFAFYNTLEEVDLLVAAVKKAVAMLK